MKHPVETTVRYLVEAMEARASFELQWGKVLDSYFRLSADELHQYERLEQQVKRAWDDWASNEMHTNPEPVRTLRLMMYHYMEGGE